MLMNRLETPATRRVRKRPWSRLVVAIVLSIGVHAAAVAAGLARWTPATDASSPTIVLVDLSPGEAPATADVVAGAADDRAAAAGAPGELERRVEALTEENAELTAGLADAERRRAEVEDEHRQEVAALRTEAGRLGEQMATLAADKQALATEKDALAAEKDVLAAERDMLAANNDALATELEAGRLRTAALEEELAARRQADEAALAELRSAHDRLVTALRREIADKDVALEQANRRLTVSIVERVLFPSGHATLTPEGEPVIDRIGAVLAAVPDSRILVEGHTDNVPIGPALQARFPSNWELSTARATEVVKRLIQQANVAPVRLRVAGRADTEPVASNDTEDGRRRNRRIEIILLPVSQDEAGES
jgi:chemotaxis protein MotB